MNIGRPQTSGDIAISHNILPQSLLFKRTRRSTKFDSGWPKLTERDFFGLVGIKIFTRPLLPEGSSLQIEILCVCLYVITSTFPIWGLHIIPESRQTPHVIHNWKEEDISHDYVTDKDTHKDKYKDKYEDNDKDKDECLKYPSLGYQI